MSETKKTTTAARVKETRDRRQLSVAAGKKETSVSRAVAAIDENSTDVDSEKEQKEVFVSDCTSKQISKLPIDQKTAKIKQWVITRLTELEEQNKKLRVQNQKCSRQLQLLKSCAERSADCRNSVLLSHSVVGRLPVERAKGGGVTNAGDSSEDSGMGDFNGSSHQVEWPTSYCQHQVACYQRIMCCSATNLHGAGGCPQQHHRSNPGTPKNARRMTKTKTSASSATPAANLHRTRSLPRQTLHSTGRRRDDRKPLPTPRRHAPATTATAYQLDDEVLRIEHDGRCGAVGVDLMCNRMTMERDSLETTASSSVDGVGVAADCPDYVNIAELQLWQRQRQSVGNGGDKELLSPRCCNGNEARKTATNLIEPLEAKLHALAHQCLEMAHESNQLRDSIISGVSVTSPRHSNDQHSSTSRTTSSDSYKIRRDPSYSGPLPVFTARHGKVSSKSKHSNLSSGGSSSSNNNQGKMCSDTTVTDLDDCSPLPPTSSWGNGPMALRNSDGSNPRRHDDSNGGHWGFINSVREEDEQNDDCSSSDGDYAVPPDAYDRLAPVNVIEGDDGIMQTSLVASPSQIEKCGYLMSVSDGIIKSLKRRWCVLRNGEVMLFKSQKDEQKQDPAVFRVTIDEVQSVTKISGKSGNTAGFQLITLKSKHQLTAESASNTDEWIKAFQTAMKSSMLVDQRQDSPCRASVRGWLLKVKYGHSKRYFATLQEGHVYFFKNAGVKVPSTQLLISGAVVSEVVVGRGSDPESSGDDGRNNNNNGGVTSGNATERQFSLSVMVDGEDPVYLVFNSKEQKDRWLFHLKLAAQDGHFDGTDFEMAIKKLMEIDGEPNNILWHEAILQRFDENVTTTLTTMVNEANTKDSIQLAKACRLFTSVAMQPSAVAYHIDLAQNTVAQALKNDDVRGELYATLIRLSNAAPSAGTTTTPAGGSTLQAWKLLALLLSVCLPSQYQLLWLLRKHLDRWRFMGGEEANMAGYCRNALQRCLTNGTRREPPSRLEATSLLTRNPSAHQLPHSIPVCLPDGGYQVVEFDGSSTVLECAAAVCAKTKLRAPTLCGFALYADDPGGDVAVTTALNPKAKICDIISKWEHDMKDCKSGKIPTGKVIKISLMHRYYWPHLSVGETERERIFLAYQMADKLKQGQVPTSAELAEELCALFAQMHFGDIGVMTNDKFECVLSRFFPIRLLEVACRTTLRAKLMEHWNDLKGSTKQDCSRVILGVLRRWRFFGAQLYPAGMRWRNDDRVALAVNDTGLHLLSGADALEPLASYPHQSLLAFGGYHDDFMLTVSRQARTADEPTKDRLTFSMPKAQVLALTLHTADYIRLRRLVATPTTAATAAVRRTPRRSPHHLPTAVC